MPIQNIITATTSLETHVVRSLLSSQVVQLGALLSEDLGLSLGVLTRSLVLLLSAPQFGLDPVISLLLLQELFVSLVVHLERLGLQLLCLELFLQMIGKETVG